MNKLSTGLLSLFLVSGCAIQKNIPQGTYYKVENIENKTKPTNIKYKPEALRWVELFITQKDTTFNYQE
jgi:hypothetical protein